MTLFYGCLWRDIMRVYFGDFVWFGMFLFGGDDGTENLIVLRQGYSWL